MAYSEAQKKATAKYNAKTYDRIEVKVTPKGSKEKIISYVKTIDQNMSLNSYIVGLIEDDMQKRER